MVMMLSVTEVIKINDVYSYYKFNVCLEALGHSE